MSVVSDVREMYKVVARVVRRRRDRKVMLRLLEEQGPLEPFRYEVAVYFADTLVNEYQMQQWYAPLAELARTTPVVVIARNVASTRRLLEQCPLPVFHGRTIAEIEEWTTTQSLKVVFYVNQNMRNFQMMRFRDPAHVFISHGESDKDYMASNQLKAYDYTFIAGQAAYERVTKRLLGYDVDARTRRIGRPQVDVDYEGPTLPDDGRTTVLYAPTWEGDRPSMSYSSIASHGPALVKALTTSAKHRIVYRPHPRTGAFDPESRKVHESLVAAIEAANAADPSAHHMVDTDTAFGWHLRAADACIADISAVAFDWLATGKTLILTEPVNPEAEVDRDGIAGLLPTLVAGDAQDILAIVAEGVDGELAARYREIAERYFGDITPGASMTRFLTAVAEILETRRTEIAAAALTGPAPAATPPSVVTDAVAADATDAAAPGVAASPRSSDVADVADVAGDVDADAELQE